MDRAPERTVTCLNRFLGRCKGCDPDYDQSHHPNNLDCPGYIPVAMMVFEVSDKLDGGPEAK